MSGMEPAESVAERLRQWTDTGQSFFDHAAKLIRDRDAQWQARVAALESKLAASAKPEADGNRQLFFRLVSDELDHAYAKHGKPQWSRHEFYTVLAEEVDELWDAIKSDAPMDEVLREAVQVAAMCFRYAETGDRYRGDHDVAAAARKPKAAALRKSEENGSGKPRT